MKIEKVDAPEKKNFALGSGSAPLGTYFVNGMSNPCRSLTVRTEAGIFTGGDRIIHDSLAFGMDQNVELRPLQSRFDVTAPSPANYWVLPLINFMPDPWQGQFFLQLTDHPLRLASWPALPDGLSEHDHLTASIYLHSRGGLYTFVINGEPGFIERMPNYEARAKRVRRDRSRRITAVMVGPAHVQSRFISLCRGFETLCRHHGFINQNLSFRLEPAQQTELKVILQEAVAKIRRMQKAETDPNRKAVLETIGSRAQNAGQTEKSFGLAVADLAQKFGFPDASVLDAHFAAHPHPTGKTWPGVLTFYRAAATHDAYFDWSQREDLYTILRVRDHLYDLLLRVLFKTIEYDGPYQSPIPPLMQRASVDWVTPTTPPGLLGFA